MNTRLAHAAELHIYMTSLWQLKLKDAKQAMNVRIHWEISRAVRRLSWPSQPPWVFTISMGTSGHKQALTSDHDHARRHSRAAP